MGTPRQITAKIFLTCRLVLSPWASAGVANRAFLSLEIGSKNQKFLENLNPAA